MERGKRLMEIRRVAWEGGSVEENGSVVWLLAQTMHRRESAIVFVDYGSEPVD